MRPATIASPGAAELRALFDSPKALTVGVEEEIMVLDAESFELAPRAREALAAADLESDPRYQLELPASQLEIVTGPAETIAEIESGLWRARSHLAAGVDGLVRLAVAGTHPMGPAQGDLHGGLRLERLAAEYGAVARLQQVCGLHVHIALSGAERVLAVHNALRGYLPELSALAGNAPFFAGSDTGMASVRPMIAGTLPRQGVPPILRSWTHFAEDLRWGVASERLGGMGEWWWELRPHARLGTLEVRVPDAQTTVAEAATVAATVAALVLWLGDRHDAGELEPPPAEWRIRENRWSAARHGLCGSLVDLESGRVRPTGERVHELIDLISPAAAAWGAVGHLGRAHALTERNGAMRQREVAATEGLEGLMRWLVDRFLEPPPAAIDLPSADEPTARR